ncbi:MAG: hypothetical protein NTV32_01175, partial [Gammaproteobacteria bacterium]|nr:hypothetical protein [Gammaproteobacteria bacterium]
MKKTVLFSAGLLIYPFLMHASITPGNGVIVDSAATDYYNHITNGQFPSLYKDVMSTTNPKPKIQYIFPDIGYIAVTEDPALAAEIDNYMTKVVNTFDTSKITITVLDEQSCTSPVIPTPSLGSNLVIVSYSFCAQPQIQRLNPADFTPFIQPDLGSSYDLSTLATEYYGKSFGPSTQVIPMINYDTDWTSMLYAIYQNKGNAVVTKSMVTLAKDITASIQNTAGINGVAFDNEPAIGKTDVLPSQAGTTQSQIEFNFFNSIATGIGSNKNLFLFDANTTAQAIYAGKTTNIVDLYALYDFETEDTTNSPSGPYALNNYNGSASTCATNPKPKNAGNCPSVSHMITNGLNLGIPIMFVLPASATSTMWNSLQAYNSTTTTPPGLVFSGNTATSACNTSLDPSGIEKTILSMYLCTASGTCPGGEPAITAYLQAPPSPNPNNTLGCSAYTNTTGTMQAYFDASLSALKT